MKAIIFDFDDTLVKTSESRYEALKYAGKKFYNLEIDDKRIRKYWGIPFKEFMAKVFREIRDTDEVIKNYVSIRDLFPLHPYEDAIETINRLLEKSYQVGIVTSLAKKMAIKDLSSLGFPVHRLFHIQAEEDTTAHKPDPKVFEPVLKALSRLKINGGQTAYVGDSLLDFLAAEGAGLNFFGLADRTTKKSEFVKKGANVIKSLSDLLVKIN